VTKLRELRDDAASCTRCDLYQRSTQTVFGEGRDRAFAGLVADLVTSREAAAEAVR